MANALFVESKDDILNGDIEFDAFTLDCELIDTLDDDPNTAAAGDDFLDDIVAGAREENSVLSGKTTTQGTFDATDFTYTAASGDPCEELLIFYDSGVAATSNLLISYDTFTSGMPVTLNGGDVDVTINASGFFSI